MPADPRRPLWLLDVDGVLNAVALEPDPAVWPRWRRGVAAADGRRYTITFAPEVTGAVAAAAAASRADVRWLTTWGADANGGLRDLLELPELPVAGVPPPRYPPAGGRAQGMPVASHAGDTGAAATLQEGRWWKFDVVRSLVEADPARPLIWTDDDLAKEGWAAEWVADHTTTAALLLAPRPWAGLSAADLAAIEDFLLRWDLSGRRGGRPRP